MKRLEIYAANQAGDVTFDQLAAAFDLTPKNLRISMTKWGARFPAFLDILDKIDDGTIDRATAAEALGVTVRTVNALAKSWGAIRPIAESTVNKQAARVKWEVQKKFAIDFIAGRAGSLDKASALAGVSERQFRRIVSALLSEHLGMVWSDLGDLPLPQLQRVAREIEKAERIAAETHRLASDISDGKVSRKDEAIKRAVEARVVKKPLGRAPRKAP